MSEHVWTDPASKPPDLNTRDVLRLCMQFADLPQPALRVAVEVVAEMWRTVEQAEEPPDEADFAADIVRRFDTLEWVVA